MIVCFICSFEGVISEMLWCHINYGYAGLVYGTFNLLYGIGAMALTSFLYLMWWYLSLRFYAGCSKLNLSAPQTLFCKFIDIRFPDARIKRIYGNMIFG